MESNFKKYTIVYLTTNTKNNKIYIGIHDTLDPNKFCGYLGCGVNRNYPSTIKHPTTPFMYAVKKYGFDSFKRTTLKIFDNREDAKKLERFLVDEEFIKREDTYNITIGGGDPPRNNRPVYQYDINGKFINCYDSCHLAAVMNGGANGSTIKIAADNNCCAFETFWSFEYVEKLDLSIYKNTIQRTKVFIYNSDGSYYKEFDSQSLAKDFLGINIGSLQRAIINETKVKGYYVSLKKVDKFVKSKVKKHNGPIYQYDLNGNYLNEFISCNYVAKFYNKKTYNRIPQVLKMGLSKCGDFLWSWNKFDNLKPFVDKEKKVGRFDSNGNLLEIYDTVREARKEYGNISRVLSGKASHCKGFVFKYI